MDKGDTDRERLIERTCDAFGHLFDALDVMAGDEPGTTWEDRSHVQPEDTAGRERRTAARNAIVMEFSEPTLADFIIRGDRDGLFSFVDKAIWHHRRRLTPTDAASAAAGSVTISLDLARLVKFDPKQLHRTGLFDEAVALQDAIRAAAESAEASGEAALTS